VASGGVASCRASELVDVLKNPTSSALNVPVMR
jgi:hypothetical protein